MSNIKLLTELGFNGTMKCIINNDSDDSDDDKKNKDIISSFDKILFQSIRKICQNNGGANFCIFGSKPFRYMNGNDVKLNSDCDIICNKRFYCLFFSMLNDLKGISVIKKIDLNGNSSLREESQKSLLKFSCINCFLTITLKITGDIDYCIDCIVVNESDGFNMENIVIRYSQNLISTKTLTYHLTKDLQFIPRYSDNLIRSLYQPDYYQSSIHALVYIMKLYIKVFDEYGMDNDGYQICSRKNVKRRVKKMNGVMWRKKYSINNKKYLKNITNETCEKLLYTMIKNKISWLSFDTSIFYRFIFFDELIRFPMSKDLKYYLTNMNLIPKVESYNSLLKRWITLLKRVYKSSIIEKIIDINYMECEDEYLLIESIKKLVTSLRMSFLTHAKEIICPICLEQIINTSPTHMCRNGHCSHLTCIIEQEKNLFVNILTSLNFDKKIGDSMQEAHNYHTICSICRDENININENYFIENNPNINGAFKCKEFNKYKKCPLDLFIDKYKKLSLNISQCNLSTNFSDYFLKKINYLSSISSKKLI